MNILALRNLPKLISEYTLATLSPFITAKRVNIESAIFPNLSECQNKQIAKKLIPINIGTTPTSVFIIAGKLQMIV
jgi:hypothetical protein